MIKTPDRPTYKPLAETTLPATLESASRARRWFSEKVTDITTRKGLTRRRVPGYIRTTLAKSER